MILLPRKTRKNGRFRRKKICVICFNQCNLWYTEFGLCYFFPLFIFFNFLLDNFSFLYYKVVISGIKWYNSMFIGEYEHYLESKNRLFLPTRLRGRIDKKKNKKFILTGGFERCLLIYPLDSWQKITKKIDSLPSLAKTDIRAFKRIFLSQACEVEPDRQGRILIPQNLRNYAGINQAVIIIGVLDHLEIWAKERWQTYQRKVQPTYTKIAEAIGI